MKNLSMEVNNAFSLVDSKPIKMFNKTPLMETKTISGFKATKNPFINTAPINKSKRFPMRILFSSNYPTRFKTLNKN